MIVSDSTPLIALTRIGQLGLLQRVYGTVLIPYAVEEEISGHPSGFGGPRPGWISVREVRDSTRVSMLRQRLDPGESEAIALALEAGNRLLIDEAAGRRSARSLGVEITGTLGTLLEAKRVGLLPNLTEQLVRLADAGFHMSPQLMTELRRAAGEE